MRSLVFIKQVPDPSEIRFDSLSKTLIREGVKNQMNPYDRRAISEAIRRRNECGAEVVVATMGPPQAKQALAEALLMGADLGIHILDPRLAGSDTLATARVLAACARKCGFDLIFCGRHSTDSETGQVPLELAEMLGIPAATSVHKLEYGQGYVLASCETDDGKTEVELPLPAVLSAAERLIRPIKVKDAVPGPDSAAKIETWDLDDLNLSPERVGVAGSPTRVAEIREYRVDRRPQKWEGLDSKSAAMRTLDWIRARTDKKEEAGQAPQGQTDSSREYWIWIERLSGKRIHPASLELMSSAAVLSFQHGGMVCPVLAGEPPSDEDVRILSSFGAHRIYYLARADHPDFVVSDLCRQIKVCRPFALLFPATSEGRIIAPRIAGRLEIGLTGDSIGLHMDGDGALVQLKPAFGGNLVAPIYSKTLPVMATIRPGSLDLLTPAQPRPVPVVSWQSGNSGTQQFKIISRQTDSGADAVRIDHSDLVIGIGMGVGQENVASVFRLADLLDGAVGATRRVVDQGWLPRQYQIGLTGKFIAPRVYVGLGISGRYNHLIGVQKAGSILAVNSDPDAEIFRMSDVGIVGDCREMLAVMLELLKTGS